MNGGRTVVVPPRVVVLLTGRETALCGETWACRETAAASESGIETRRKMSW